MNNRLHSGQLLPSGISQKVDSDSSFLRILPFSLDQPVFFHGAEQGIDSSGIGQPLPGCPLTYAVHDFISVLGTYTKYVEHEQGQQAATFAQQAGHEGIELDFTLQPWIEAPASKSPVLLGPGTHEITEILAPAPCLPGWGPEMGSVVNRSLPKGITRAKMPLSVPVSPEVPAFEVS